MDSKQTIKRLTSTDSKTRQQGITILQQNIQTTPSTLYKKLCYGLFFYYWHSDGFADQETDAETIANLLSDLPNKRFVLLFKSLFLSLKKLWFKIDYHRTSKYLNLLNHLYKKVYSVLKQKNKTRLYIIWNDFLVDSLFFDHKGSLKSEGNGVSVSVCYERSF